MRGDFDLVVWAAGAQALPWLRASGLATDERGFVLVDEQLRSVSHPEVFAAGDCATLRHAPHAKSGVYAVRHGEVLAQNR
ncbi:Pyridine nucleotide-disulfide oxidoreductase [compost metagenome]